MTKLLSSQTLALVFFIIGVVSMSFGLLHLIAIIFDTPTKLIIYFALSVALMIYGAVQYHEHEKRKAIERGF